MGFGSRGIQVKVLQLYNLFWVSADLYLTLLNLQWESDDVSMYS